MFAISGRERRLTIALVLAIILNVALPASVFAFDVDGYHTGMTTEEAAALAAQRGLTLRAMSGFDTRSGNAGYIGVSSADASAGPWINLVFCNYGLVDYLREIDFDADYIPTLENLLRKYGTPQRVAVQRRLWNGPGGGYVYISQTDWDVGADQITLEFNPEGRSGTGALRYNRAANIDYSTRSRCLKKEEE